MKALGLFLFVLAAYLGLELWAANRVGYRLEPLYIFDQFAAEQRAVARCGVPEGASARQFDANFVVVQRRVARSLANADAKDAPTDEAIAAEIAARNEARGREVDVLVDDGGCADPQVDRLRKRYRIHARLRAGRPDIEARRAEGQ